MPTTIEGIKMYLEQRIGQSVVVTAQAGRKKVAKHVGVLEKTYPAIFMVSLAGDEDSMDRISYSYTDLLIHNISLEFDSEF
ncbi:MAG: Veg family protein [Limosilactobacillus sp.]|uniref:Veg family protein n=1 Tax=Limosilactobacillus sp. TaxID=2773925 RepID=UPI0026F63DD7|nr:Veg family protein [Limosilactobacillus sp.]